MVRRPKRYWKLNKIISFKSDFQKLSSSYEKWRVGKTLEYMLSMKDPSKVYKFARCDECREGLYLFGIVDDGLGNKGFELQVFLDRKKKILSPITIRKVLKSKKKEKKLR